MPLRPVELVIALGAVAGAMCGERMQAQEDAPPPVPLVAEPQGGQRCTPRPPATWPIDASKLIDTAALGTLQAAPPALPAATTLYSLGFDGRGRLVRVVTLSSTLPDSVARRLTTVVASVIEPPPDLRIDRVRLKVTTGPASRVEIQPSDFCEVEPRFTQLPAVRFQNALKDSRDTAIPDSQGAVEVTIDERGQVAVVRLLKSNLTPGVQDALIETARSISYYPALNDRTPTVGTDTIVGLVRWPRVRVGTIRSMRGEMLPIR
jgi:hypothetical protein